MAKTSKRWFTVDTTGGDTTAPTITVHSPLNNTYYTTGSILLNISADENLDWVRFYNQSNNWLPLVNYSMTYWNDTLDFAEGQQNITFAGNDTSSNENQGKSAVVISVDLNNPSVEGFGCAPNAANDNQDVNCTANVSDALGLDYAIIGHNATGSWQNSSQINLVGTNVSASYIIASGNTTPAGFLAEVYVYDNAARTNTTTNFLATVNDNTFPQIYNFSYIPNSTDVLDPGVKLNINYTIVEDYNLTSVVLMYQNVTNGTWQSINMSNYTALTVGGASAVIYTASITPQNGTWFFQVNVTDSAGNENVSSNTSVVVAPDISFSNSTDIPTIKSFTFAQRKDNSTLGWFLINNTGDSNVNFTLNVTSTIRTRFNINKTSQPNATYELSAGEEINLTIQANTTSLTSNLYGYNLSLATEPSIGATVLENQLNIQTAAGPYLVVTIDTFTSSITRGTNGVEFSAVVENLGSQGASNTELNWTIPSQFTLATGNLRRDLGTLGIGVSGRNTITVDVSSSGTNTSVIVNATGASTGSIDSDLKTITLTNPATTTTTTTTGAGGGSGGGGGGTSSGGGSSTSTAFNRVIQVVRGPGGEASFNISVAPLYVNSTLQDLTLTLTGYPSQYISIIPSLIGQIGYGEVKDFEVVLTAPAYAASEEYNLTASISGGIVLTSGVLQQYTETHNIRLIIQSVGLSPVQDLLAEAQQAVLDMGSQGFNFEGAEKLLLQARDALENHNNQLAFDLAEQVIEMKELAFETDNLIRTVVFVLINPRKTTLLASGITGNVIGLSYGVDLGIINPEETLSRNDIPFDSPTTRELLSLSLAAFERGDYPKSNGLVMDARNDLILNRKGNFGLFLYLYWHLLLLGMFVFSLSSVVRYRRVQKTSISTKIEEIDEKESNITGLMSSNQRNYYSGKIGSGEYHRVMNQHQKKISSMRKQRFRLRNRRVKLLKPEEVNKDLRIERMQIESEIKSVQKAFYIDKKIPELSYNLMFKSLNERLAEIESERTTLSLMKSKKDLKKKKNGKTK